jgi:hypothetical protein
MTRFARRSRWYVISGTWRVAEGPTYYLPPITYDGAPEVRP